MSKDEKIEFDCVIVNETSKAFKLEIMITSKKSKTIWFGKTVVTVIGNSKGTKATIPQWLAEKEGLL